MPIKPDFDAADAAEDWIFNQKSPSLRKQVHSALQKVWDESKVNRVPAGNTKGGQFSSSNRGASPEPGKERKWKRGPGMLMPGATKSWQKFLGRAEVVGQAPAGQGIHKPKFLRITREDGTTINAVEKYVGDDDEKANEVLAYKLSQKLGATVPITEVSGEVVRQEFIPGKTLVDEFASRIEAMNDKEFQELYDRVMPNSPFQVSERNYEGMLSDLYAYVRPHHFPEYEAVMQDLPAALVDFLMDQHDRNLGNLLFDDKGKLWLIDNGNTGDPDTTYKLDTYRLPQASALIQTTLGWELEAPERQALTEIRDDPSYPEAVSFRAGFLLQYGKMPGGEAKAMELWNNLIFKLEAQRRKKK